MAGLYQGFRQAEENIGEPEFDQVTGIAVWIGAGGSGDAGEFPIGEAAMDGAVAKDAVRTLDDIVPSGRVINNAVAGYGPVGGCAYEFVAGHDRKVTAGIRFFIELVEIIG